mmetsp:Transcript_11109/g.39265  ORF Transcript_11109/g.39265 Transcript_11109/m.39265 type:complete len:334 (+) Transcript_11109:5116-6117(+)
MVGVKITTRSTQRQRSTKPAVFSSKPEATCAGNGNNAGSAVGGQEARCNQARSGSGSAPSNCSQACRKFAPTWTSPPDAAQSSASANPWSFKKLRNIFRCGTSAASCDSEHIQIIFEGVSHDFRKVSPMRMPIIALRWGNMRSEKATASSPTTPHNFRESCLADRAPNFLSANVKMSCNHCRQGFSALRRGVPWEEAINSLLANCKSSDTSLNSSTSPSTGSLARSRTHDLSRAVAAHSKPDTEASQGATTNSRIASQTARCVSDILMLREAPPPCPAFCLASAEADAPPPKGSASISTSCTSSNTTGCDGATPHLATSWAACSKQLNEGLEI